MFTEPKDISQEM